MISVIVPVYNVAPYLPRCVDSILAQTYPDFELILIDDGSADESGAICDDYAQKDKRIVVIHKPNGGVSSARNAGLERCTGEFISFIDSDDWIEPTMFQDLHAAVVETGADFAVCNETRVYDTGDGIRTQEIDHWPEIHANATVDRDGVYQRIFVCSVVLWNKLFRRSIMNDARFDTELCYGEDCILLLEILKNVETAVIVPGNYYNYFISRPGNVLSAEIDERSLNLLENARRVYFELAHRGYPQVGIRRIIIAIQEVIKKIPGDYSDPQYKKYMTACAALAKVPSFENVITFLKSRHATVKGKISFVLLRSIYPLWVIMKNLKKRVSN